MKLSLSIFCIILTQVIFGQNIYEPIFISQCTNRVDNDIFWFVVDSTEFYGRNNIEHNSISLPRSGQYELHFDIGEDPITIEITPNVVNRDTILLRKIKLFHHIGKPPQYFDCYNLANGVITDYYYNGTIRMQGIFKNGQPIDSLFSYHREGPLSELIIPSGTDLKVIRYFINGHIQSIYDSYKRYKLEYYQSGQLKKEEYWTNKYHYKVTEYFQNGNISRISNDKELKIFDERGALIEKIKRKEILILNRIFANSNYDRHNKLYKYKWEIFDNHEMIKRIIIFNTYETSLISFPDRIEQIDEHYFDKIVFYMNGLKIRKIEFKYVPEINDYTKQLIVYRKENKDWTIEKITSLNNIYEIIKSYSE